MTITTIIIFLSILFTLVVIHELGHFLLAKYFKMRVDEFAFGFPPKLLQKKVGETVYSFNLIPLGGYVKIFGENGLDEEDLNKLSEHDRSRLFGNMSAYKRILVLCGGVVFNILGAIILFAITFMIGSNVGIDETEAKTIPFESREMLVVSINDKSSLVGTGIAPGDKIVGLESDGDILTGDMLYSGSAREFIQSHINSKITINYQNATGQISQAQAIPQAGIVEGKKVLGAGFADTTFKKYSFIDSLVEGSKTAISQLLFIFISLGQLFTDLVNRDAKVEDSLSGPIGLAVMTSKVSEKGLDQIFAFAAMLSLSLAAFNILPIPALDGGRVVFVLVEVLRGKKIKASTEQLFHGLGFLLLLCLMIFVSYFDIVKAIGLN